jgi:glycerol-3-phosphate O-acyltransferase
MDIKELFEAFESSYVEGTRKGGFPSEKAREQIGTLKRLVQKELQAPTLFESYHEREKAPFDYYRFGLDFFRPLIDKKGSSFVGEEKLHELVDALKKGENAVWLANHQTEPDPQIISLMLEEKFPELAEQMVFVAGHRVTSDPVAIPFSRGRNLICIYSKRHIENPPEKKEEKTLHNRKAIESLKKLLHEGGKCIYVAPSGGRDRPDAQGNLLPAPFDASSVELFRILAKGTKTRFYPFSMKTYAIMPPPPTVEKALGEKRIANYSPVHLALGEKIDFDLHDSGHASKEEARETRAQAVYDQVLSLYLKES